MKAAVILMKCPEAKLSYGVRVEESHGDWLRTWAFAVPPERAAHEGYDKTSVTGSLNYTSEYNGCPYCGSKEFVICGRCGKLSCWNREERISCGWCGLTGNITRTEEDLSVSGGDI